MLAVDPDNGIPFGHDHLPEDILGVLVGLEKTVFGYIALLVSFLPVDELANSHPHVINMPALKNPPEIFPEEHANKPPLLINNIDPQTLISIGHDLKCLPQPPRSLNLDILSLAGLQQRVDIDRAVIRNL